MYFLACFFVSENFFKYYFFLTLYIFFILLYYNYIIKLFQPVMMTIPSTSNTSAQKTGQTQIAQGQQQPLIIQLPQQFSSSNIQVCL